MSQQRRRTEPPINPDHHRQAILARRSRMITAALAGAGLAAGLGACEPPRPCLSVRACLSEVIIDPPDGGEPLGPEAEAGTELRPADGGSDAAAQIAVDPPPEPGPAPTICLSFDPLPDPVPEPTVCLSVAPPPKPGPPPKVCLRVAPPPRPCLKLSPQKPDSVPRIPPGACLWAPAPGWEDDRS